MTETVEGSITVEEEKSRTDKKDPIKIRISLFYDGTLNNRKNIEEREKEEISIKDGAPDKGSEIYRKFHSKSANSYDNGRTNIAIMEPHVEETAEGYDLFYKAYIAGQGPITHQADSFWGYALAIGSTGVPGRAEEGIDTAANFILDEIG